MVALLACGPLVAACSSGADIFSKDAEWFSRPGRVFIRSVSIETPPLTPDKPVTADDLVSAEGACPGMTAPADANASTATPFGFGALEMAFDTINNILQVAEATGNVVGNQRSSILLDLGEGYTSAQNQDHSEHAFYSRLASVFAEFRNGLATALNAPKV